MKKNMFRFLFILLTFSYIAQVNAQESEQKLYRIYASTQTQVKQLAEQGIDIYNIVPGKFVEVLTYPFRIENLKQSELKIEFIAHSFKELIERELGDQLSEYHNYETTYQELTSIAHDPKYPPITRLDTIGHSLDRRVIGALKVSDNPELDEDEPVILIAGCHHGNEILTVEAPLVFIHYLVDNYGSDPEITRWVDSYEIWFIPLVNPDGRENLRRSNNNGVDLNRNYSFQFVAGGSHGPDPFSEPETQVVRDFAAAHPPVLSMTYHTSGRLVLYSWTHTDGLAPDMPILTQIGGTVSDSLDYTLRQGGHWYFTEGEYCDFMYGVHGCMAFTIEMYNSQTPPASVIDQVMERNVPGFIALMNMVEKSGLTGLITDSETDEPIEAVIEILEIDDQGLLYPRKSNPKFGRFYRYLTPGNYTVKISAPGYTTRIFKQVAVDLDSLTILDAKLNKTAYLFVENVHIDDDSSGLSVGNGNGLVNNHEKIRLGFSAVNQSHIAAHRVNAFISTTNPNIEMLRDSLFLGNFEFNDIIPADSFLFYIRPSADNGEKFDFILSLRDSSGMEWNKDVALENYAPALSFDSLEVIDFDGNQNSVLNNGETAWIEISVKNSGRQNATELLGTLRTTDNFADILIDSAMVPLLPIGESRLFSFQVQLKSDAPKFHTADFYLEIDALQKTDFQSRFQLNNVDGLFDNFESRYNGWTHKSWMMSANHHDDWQWGRPQGKAGDPALPYSGANCWGTDLGYADYDGLSWNGYYQHNVNNYLLSPEIDCSGLTDVGLKFMRWLTVAPGDEARIRVNFMIVWESPASGLYDTRWQEQIVDISAYADNKSSVKIMFELQSNGDDVWAGGWNIDDFLVTGGLVSGVSRSKAEAIQLNYFLYDNFPNPFNPDTKISYAIPKNQYVELKIFDVLGRKIKTLIREKRETGFHQTTWDGTDENGNAVASGLYFYQLKTGEFSATKKLLLLK